MSRRKEQADDDVVKTPDHRSPAYLKHVAKRRGISVAELLRRERERVYVPEPRGTDDAIFYD